jgi:hypothetical protein
LKNHLAKWLIVLTRSHDNLEITGSIPGCVQFLCTAVPYAKGEGALQMVANLVSVEYGWLQLTDGKEAARSLFKAGKN